MNCTGGFRKLDSGAAERSGTMMFKYEGAKCPVCHAYLMEDDDIVVCPDCGAPHHRECWKSLGHCGCEELHAQGKAWTMPQQEGPAPETGRGSESSAPFAMRRTNRGRGFVPAAVRRCSRARRSAVFIRVRRANGRISRMGRCRMTDFSRW